MNTEFNTTCLLQPAHCSVGHDHDKVCNYDLITLNTSESRHCDALYLPRRVYTWQSSCLSKSDRVSATVLSLNNNELFLYHIHPRTLGTSPSTAATVPSCEWAPTLLLHGDRWTVSKETKLHITRSPPLTSTEINLYNKNGKTSLNGSHKGSIWTGRFGEVFNVEVTIEKWRKQVLVLSIYWQWMTYKCTQSVQWIERGVH